MYRSLYEEDIKAQALESGLTQDEINALKQLFKDHEDHELLSFSEQVHIAVRAKAAEILIPQKEPEKMPIHITAPRAADPELLMRLSSSKHQLALRNLFIEAMEHAREVLLRRPTSLTQNDRIGIWANSIRQALQGHAYFSDKPFEELFKFLKDPASWEEIGTLKSRVYLGGRGRYVSRGTASNKEEEMIKKDVRYWAEQSLDSVSEEIQIREELEAMKREVRSAEGITQQADKLVERGEKVTDDLCKLAESLAA